MCSVSLKDRKLSKDLYNLQGIQSMVDVVRHGRKKHLYVQIAILNMSLKFRPYEEFCNGPFDLNYHL